MPGPHLVQAGTQDDRYRQETGKEGAPEGQEDRMDLLGQRLGEHSVGGEPQRREQHENRAKGIA